MDRNAVADPESRARIRIRIENNPVYQLRIRIKMAALDPDPP